MSYATEIRDNKTYVGNVIVYFRGKYFSVATPDSGLSISEENRGLVSSVVLAPTSIDPRRVSTTIAEISFKLLDREGRISALNLDNSAGVVGEAVQVYLGRTGISMAFADYHPLPTVYVRSVSKQDNGYSFSCVGETDRMNRGIYQTAGRVSGDIFADTTSFAAKDSIADFPSAGVFRIEKEFISYTSKNNTTKTFSGLTRGEYNTTAAAHADDSSIELADYVTGNPIDILLKLLVSSGGGSAYDVLQDGVGLDQSLVDITEMESLRDLNFPDREFGIGLYAIDNALSFIETQLLEPNRLRFTYSDSAKLTVALLDKAIFNSADETIDEDTIVGFPTFVAEGAKVVNNLKISWDYDEDTGIFGEIETFQDAASVAAYGVKDSMAFEWKGVKASLDGSAFVTDFKENFFRRLSIPSPEISLHTQMDKSLLNIGRKARLNTRRLANELGQLGFDSDVEVISRGINWQTGDVSLKLQFTALTGVRSCFLAPSDTIGAVTSQSIVTLGSGRGLYWEEGWKVRLWDNTAGDYTADAVNTISSIVGDVVTFENNFSTTLTTHHRLKFPDFDDAVAEQRRYCFISPTGLDFSGTQKSYKIAP